MDEIQLLNRLLDEEVVDAEGSLHNAKVDLEGVMSSPQRSSRIEDRIRYVKHRPLFAGLAIVLIGAIVAGAVVASTRRSGQSSGATLSGQAINVAGHTVRLPSGFTLVDDITKRDAPPIPENAEYACVAPTGGYELDLTHPLFWATSVSGGSISTYAMAAKKDPWVGAKEWELDDHAAYAFTDVATGYTNVLISSAASASGGDDLGITQFLEDQFPTVGPALFFGRLKGYLVFTATGISSTQLVELVTEVAPFIGLQPSNGPTDAVSKNVAPMCPRSTGQKVKIPAPSKAGRNYVQSSPG